MRTIVKVPCFQTDSFIKLGLSGRTGNSIVYINLSELFLPLEWKNYYKIISNLLGTNVSSGKAKDLSKYNDQMEKTILLLPWLTDLIKLSMIRIIDSSVI